MLGGYTTYDSITTRTTKETDATGNIPSVPQDHAAGGGILEDEVGAAVAAAAEGRRSRLLFRRTIPPRSVAALLVGLLVGAAVLVALSTTDLRGAGDGGIGGLVVSWRSSSTDTHQRGREELPMEDADDSEKQQPIEWEEYVKQNLNNDEGDDDNNDDNNDDDDDDDDDGYGIFGRCKFDDAIPLVNLPRFHHNQGVKFEVNGGKYFCFLECNDADSCFTHLHISCTKDGGTHADVWFKTNERCLMCSSQGIEYSLMMRNNGWHKLGILWPDFPGQPYLYINEVRYCPL